MLKKKKTIWELIAKAQKPIVVICLLSFVLLLVYALIFFTPFYEFYSKTDVLFAGGGRGSTYTNWVAAGIDYTTLPQEALVLNDLGTRYSSINMAYFARCLGDYSIYGEGTIQSLNHWIFRVALIGILVSLVLFIYRAQLRKNFYITNYVVNGAWSVFSFSMSILLMTKLNEWKNIVHQIDIETINKYRAYKELELLDLNSMDWIFTLGYVVAAIIIVAGISLIVLSVAKYFNTAKRNKEKALEAQKLAEVK